MNSRSLAWLLGAIAAALLVIAGLLCVRQFVVALYRVPTAGMAPTISPGDLIVGYKLAYFHPSDVHRGDLLIYRAKWDGRTDVYVKRVIGVPGDRVRTFGPRVAVNGAELAHAYVKHDGAVSIYEETESGVQHQIGWQSSLPPRWAPPDITITVPAGAFFVMGDNRTNSQDSRYTGCIRWADVVGKVIWGAR